MSTRSLCTGNVFRSACTDRRAPTGSWPEVTEDDRKLERQLQDERADARFTRPEPEFLEERLSRAVKDWRLVPVVSAPEDAARELDASTVAGARRALEELVAGAGGPNGSTPIPVDHLSVPADLFDAWARYHGSAQSGGVIRFGPQPGLWHSLQGVLPLSDTNRWNKLRRAVVQHLEQMRGWSRVTPPRGSVFLITDDSGSNQHRAD